MATPIPLGTINVGNQLQLKSDTGDLYVNYGAEGTDRLSLYSDIEDIQTDLDNYYTKTETDEGFIKIQTDVAQSGSYWLDGFGIYGNNAATSGLLRFPNSSTIGFRNFANSGNFLFGINSADRFTMGTGLNVNGTISQSVLGAVLKSDPFTGEIQAAIAGSDYVEPSALSGYLPLTGGTITGDLTATANLFINAPDYSSGTRRFVSWNTSTGLLENNSAAQVAAFISGQNINTTGTAAVATTWGGSTANFSVNQAPANSAGVASYNITSNQWEYLSKANLQTALGITGGPFLPLTGGNIVGGADVLSVGSSGRKVYFSPDANGVSLFSGAGQTGAGIYFDAANNSVKTYTSATLRATTDASGNNTWAGSGTFGGTLTGTSAAFTGPITAGQVDGNIRLTGGATDALDGFIGAAANGTLYFRNWAGTRGFTITPSNLLDHTGALSVAGDITANSFIKSGGTSAQFLKADGSVDGSTYLTSSTGWTTSGNQTGLTGDKSTTGTLEIEKSGGGTTVANGLTLTNKSASSTQYSPSLTFKGKGPVGTAEQFQLRMFQFTNRFRVDQSLDTGSSWGTMLDVGSNSIRIGTSIATTISSQNITTPRTSFLPDVDNLVLSGFNFLSPITSGSLAKWSGTNGLMVDAVAGTDYVAPSSLASYVPYTGATTALDLGSHEFYAGALSVGGSYAGGASAGLFYNNDIAGTGLDVTGGSASTFGLRVRNYDNSVTAMTLLGNGNVTFGGTATINSLSGTGNRIVQVNASGNLSATAQILTNSATLDFPSTNSQEYSDLTISVSGASTSDSVWLGIPNDSVVAGSSYTAWVSSANTVTVRLNNYSVSSINPASGLFKVTIVKF